jgi:hypothetical protein
MVGKSPDIPLTPVTLEGAATPNFAESVRGAYGAPQGSMLNPARLATSEVSAPTGYPTARGGPFLTLASYDATAVLPQRRVDATGDDPIQANGTPPHIKVQFQDAGENAPQTRPTATIQQDGSVLDGAGNVAIDKTGKILNEAFLATPPMQSDLTIQVQRDQGQTAGPTEAQQKVLNKLTDIWGQNIQNAYGDKLQTIQTVDGQTIKQVSVDDPQNLVSVDEKQKFGNGIPPERIASTTPPEKAPELPPEAPERQISPSTSGMAQRVNNDFPQGQSGEIPVSQAEQYYPRRTVAPSEGNDSDYLNMLSSLAQQGVDKARHVPNGQRFGLYDTGPRTFGTWLLNFLPADILEKLGHPPDWSKLAELLKDPKYLKEMQDALKAKGAPAELQANFANPEAAQKFAEFAGKVMTGKGEITAEDMKKFMPEALQSKIALDTVRGYKAAGATPSDIALGYQLDKPPKELTAQERDGKEAKAITAASNRLYQMSHARQGAQPNDELRWTGDNIDPNSVAFRLVHNAAATMDGTAYGCVRSHQANMQKTFGFRPHGNAFDAFKDTWRHLQNTGKFDLIPISSASQLRTGDIFGVPWTGKTTREMGWGVNAGHVGTIAKGGANGTEYSQKAFSNEMIFSGRYDTSRLMVIRAKTSQT